MTGTPRLTLADLPHRRRPRPGIVHLGLGAFFRAHGALYLEDTIRPEGGDWGVIGVSLRRPEIRDRLAPQGWVYTAAELGPDGPRYRHVDIVNEVLVAPENPAAVLQALQSAEIRIVTLTVTEKGYHRDPATGRLRLDDPAIAADLAHPETPSTAIGFIARALDLRRLARHRPFTVLSCDNLPDNGRLTRALVLEFARAVDPGLAEWIADHGRFPSAMVDRIVPATTETDIETVAAATGRLDRAPVMHEPFRQWVIEDRFVDDDRPRLETAGVQMVRDVAPYEQMKLRCLNGTHSALAYLGYLSGYATIRDTVGDPVFSDLCTRLWRDEIGPTLNPPPGADVEGYAAQLMQRYQNPAIRHETWQIAMDGSQKLPQRLLGTISDNLAADRPCPALMLSVAGWMRYASGMDEAGAPIDVRDPLAPRLAGLWQANPSAEARVDAYLALTEVFGTLAKNPQFRRNLIDACASLESDGARRAVERSIA